MVVKVCNEIIYERCDDGSTLLIIYGLLYDKVVKLEILRCFVSGLLIWVDMNGFYNLKYNVDIGSLI